MTQEKKRNIKVIALAIICIILAASTVGTLALYLTNQTQLSAKDQTIDSQNQQISALELQLTRLLTTNTTQNNNLNAQITELNAELSAFNESYTALLSDYMSSQSIIQLEKSGTLYSDSLTQDANSTTALYSGELLYAGFITVTVTATANTTFVRTSYSYGGLAYDYNQTVGNSGTVLFPVLPTTIDLTIGNVNQTAVNSVNATATFYY